MRANRALQLRDKYRRLRQGFGSVSGVSFTSKNLVLCSRIRSGDKDYGRRLPSNCPPPCFSCIVTAFPSTSVNTMRIAGSNDAPNV